MKKLCMLFLFSLLFSGVAGSYLVEFENFTVQEPAKVQNWKIANGNSYVQFHKEGAVIESTLNLQEDGDYYIWVRAWANNDVFRKGELSVNGRIIGLFGDGKPEGAEPGWTWQRSAEKYHFPGGPLKIRVVGKSPYTRFDALVLTTTDEKYTGKVTGLPGLQEGNSETLSPNGNIIKLPQLIGKGEPVLVFSGMRPWLGREFANIFARSGARVLPITGPYLDGYSGAPIKQHMVDKIEPRPWDGVTPAFAQLSRYKLVIFHLFVPELLEKMLTPERIAALKAYVEQGGNLLFTRNAPNNCGELLPVVLGADQRMDPVYYANRPEGGNFAEYPDPLPVYGIYRKVTPVEGAQVLSMIRDPEGREVAPFLVRKKLGRGTVAFLNAERNNPTQMKAYGNWVYGDSFLASVANECGGLSLKTAHLVRRPAAIPERTPVEEEITVAVTEPVLQISPESSSPVVEGDTAVFADGSRLVVKEGCVDFWLPGQDAPLMRNARMPEIRTLGMARSYTSESAEATGVNDITQALDLDLQYRGMEAAGNTVVLHYASSNTAMDWIFQSGTFDLDGRLYRGYGDRVVIARCPALVGSVEFASQLTVKEPLFARRFSCYMEPRGYTDADMSGKTNGDTRMWSTFASGQPFEYVACRNGVYLGHISAPFSTSQRLFRKAGSDAIEDLHVAGFGRLAAPVESPWYWHWFSEGPENGHNDYLAIYQYLRRSLRRQAGLRELPAYPHTEISYRVTDAERAEVYRKAAAAGYRFLMRQNPESPIDKLPETLPMCREIADAGLNTYSWSAGSYVQGRDGWVYKNHPEWFARDSKGEIQRYFATATTPGYPVIDINNAEFRKWYQQTVQVLLDQGKLRWIYRDMDGTASGIVNFALPQSPDGIQSQIQVYRFFHEQDCRVGIEGENPLVIDQFWYRAAIYAPLAGKEFSLVGTAPWCNLEGGVGLDPFRLGMYGCFPRFEIEATFLGVDRIVDEVKRGMRVVSLVKPFNAALDQTGMPFIRETPFGTTWIGEKGGALLFWNPAKKVTVQLPEGWRIRGVEGNVLTNVPGDSIFLLEKN